MLEYPELGMEAVWRIEVVNFPAFIVIDDKGNTAYVLSLANGLRLLLVGYESGAELQAALDAGFEVGDPLRVWVRAQD